MTDAIIPTKNETDCFEQTKNVNDGVNATADCEDHTVKRNQDCSCNETTSADSVSTNSETNAQQLTNITDLNKSPENSQAATENNIKPNVILDSDTVMKYVYNKDDNANITEKSKGHVKNSLKRRKRSLNKDIIRYAASAPVIVNYKTTHPPPDGPFERIRDVIKSSDLADFSIETLHKSAKATISENTKVPPKKEYYEPKVITKPDVGSEDVDNKDYQDGKINNEPYRSSEENSDESSEKSDYVDNRKELERERTTTPSRESDESDESNEDSGEEPLRNRNNTPYRNREGSSEKSDYRDSKEEPRHDQNNTPYRNSEESSEKDDYKDSREEPRQNLNSKPYRGTDESSEKDDYRDSREEPRSDLKREPYQDNERNDYRDREDPSPNRYNAPYRDNDESAERNDYRDSREQPRRNIKRKHYQESGERSNDRDSREEPRRYRKSKPYRLSERSSESSDERYSKKESRHDRLPYQEKKGRGERNDYGDSGENAPRKIIRKPYRESERRSDKGEFRDGKKSHQRDSESNEKDYPRDKSSYKIPPKERYDLEKREESEYPTEKYPRKKKDSYSLPPQENPDSRDDEQNEDPSYPKRTDNSDSQESDKNSYRGDEILVYNKPRVDSTENIGKENYTENGKLYENKPSTVPEVTVNRYYKKSDPPVSNLPRPAQINDESEEEEEQIIAIMRKKNRKTYDKHPLGYNSDIKEHTNKSIPVNIKDVDLDDFSYERIKVNEKGQVEPVRDTHENYETDSQVEIAPILTTSKPEIYSKESEQYSRSIENIDVSLSGEQNDDSRQSDRQTHINDGEVRPVVEINRDSGESNEESAKETLKAHPETEDTSLETLLGVKITDENEQNDKILLQPEEKSDVKQQFERIPLNYNHDKKEQKQDNEDTNPELKEQPEVNPDEVSQNEGTLDVLTPTEQPYDEKLNIKFDDVAIKLPDIKLPEDILSYAYEVPNYATEKDEVNPNYFQYNEDYTAEEKPRKKKKKSKKNDDDYDDHKYPSYYGDDKQKDDYTKQYHEQDDEQDDDDVDLYEKFVRERFGKRGSFEKRSEKIEDARPIAANKELFKTLNQVLKKTEDIEKQAQKSGDPNAGYMWTLEYGQNL